MKCVVCHNDDIEKKLVKEALPSGNDLGYVNIEDIICSNCGERYYNRRTRRFLEEVEGELKQGTAKLKQVGKALVYE